MAAPLVAREVPRAHRATASRAPLTGPGQGLRAAVDAIRDRPHQRLGHIESACDRSDD
ncbi:hypothetical protein [Streptomyces sp. NPDC059604]|uniref:hypothetical protein n=1 Tax=Streptomyces sp. NPDC059604 TaxID=3346881 RepID=UPI0036A91EA9